MKLDAGKIFDTNEVAISAGMGTPASAEYFREGFIDLVSKVDNRVGRELEAAFLEAICDYQREGFIIGFKSAFQLLMDCMPGNNAQIRLEHTDA